MQPPNDCRLILRVMVIVPLYRLVRSICPLHGRGQMSTCPAEWGQCPPVHISEVKCPFVQIGEVNCPSVQLNEVMSPCVQLNEVMSPCVQLNEVMSACTHQCCQECSFSGYCVQWLVGFEGARYTAKPIYNYIWSVIEAWSKHPARVCPLSLASFLYVVKRAAEIFL